MTLAFYECLICGSELTRGIYTPRKEDYLKCSNKGIGDSVIFCPPKSLEIVGYDLTFMIESVKFNIQSYQEENITIINSYNLLESERELKFNSNQFYTVPKYELKEFINLTNRLIKLQYLI